MPLYGADVAYPSRFRLAWLLWVFPALLLVLTIHQGIVALEIRETFNHGIPAVAEITNTFTTDRVDVTYDFVGVRVRLPDGRMFEREEMPVPHTFYRQIISQPQIKVLLRPGSSQPVVFAQTGHAHWRMAAINAAISFMAFLIVTVGVFSWNRYLSRRGDPSMQPVEPVSHGAPAT